MGLGKPSQQSNGGGCKWGVWEREKGDWDADRQRDMLQTPNLHSVIEEKGERGTELNRNS